MSLSNTTVKAIYQGNGATTTFAIPFTPIFDDSAETKVYEVAQPDPLVPPILTLLEEGALNDYTLTGAPDPDSFNVNVEMNVAPAATTQIIVIRELPLTQTVDMSVSNFRPPVIELGLDRIVAMVQQMAEVLTRTVRADVGEGNPDSFYVLPYPEAGSLLGWDTLGGGIVNFTPAEILAEALEGGGVPLGGLEGAVLAKASDDDGDAEWLQLNYEGYSARYGQSVDLANVQETLDFIMQMQYTGPAVVLSASGNVLREKGDAVTSTTLTAAITKRSDPIAEVRFYDVTGGNTLLDTQVSGGGIPNGGNSTYSWTGSFDDNQTFRAEADDDGATGGPTTASSTTTFSFVYPYYHGADAAGISAADVALLTKSIIASNGNLTRTFSPNGSQVLYFAYPASYGALVSIFDVNNFNTIADWTLRTENITGLDGNPVSYRIYEFNNVPLSGTYDYRFVR